MSASTATRRISVSNSVIPTPHAIKVDTRGAVILNEDSPQTRDSRNIYLPNHVEPVSHIAVDIGGSLAKVVYFTRSPQPPDSPSLLATFGSNGGPSSGSSSDAPRTPPDEYPPATTPPSAKAAKFNGALTPLVLNDHQNHGLQGSYPDALFCAELARRTSLHNFPGGSLNFERFETEHIEECVDFIKELVELSAEVNGVSIEEMKASVKIMATGGGAHKFYELFSSELGVEVRREDEMECLITGLKFLTLIPSEVYSFSDHLMRTLPTSTAELERPSPNPPQYQVQFEDQPSPQLPCLLVNIGSGVSIIKVDEDGNFERVSGTSLGGGTLWGLLSLLTPATTFDEMLELSEQGDNATVDMLVGDIYGQDYSRLGLKSTMIASSFGKVFKKGRQGEKKVTPKPEDISKSLLYAISNNIGQIA
ncbi:hypothetical protein FRC00_001698 [Tulasnella sp. 408]|nr:hypothetical protein FRC00_001698 [Tulasnella sp. 408]